MEEYLKSTRTLHRLLITVSVIFLAFALAPNQLKEVQNALDELDLIRRIPYRQYVKFVDGANKEQFRTNVKALHFPVSENARLIRPFYCMLPGPEATLNDHRLFFEAPTPVAYFVPEYLKDPTRLFEFIELNKKNNIKELISIELKYPDIKFLQYGPNRVEIKELLSRLPQKGDNVYALYEFSYKDSPDASGSISLDCYVYETKTSRHSYPFFWLQQLPSEFHELIITSGVDKKVFISTSFLLYQNIQSWVSCTFPRLQKVWDHVAGRTLAEATVYLKREIAFKRRNLTLLGITFDAQLAVWAGLVGMLGIILFLAIYLARLVGMVNGREEEIRLFPWIPLFPGMSSRCVSIITNIALPICASFFLVVRVYDHDKAATWLGPVFLVLTFICSILVEIEAAVIRSKLSKKNS